MNRRGAESPGRAALYRDGPILVVLVALALVMTNPLVLHLADAVEDKQDGLLNVWIIGWVSHALVTDPLNLFNANIFAPYPNSLYYSEILLPQGLLALPINLAANNPILGYNLVLLFSLVLAGYGMYLLVLDHTHHRGAALVAGLIFAYSPFNLGNLAQIQLLSLGWLPLALLFFRRLLARAVPVCTRPWTRSLRYAVLFALCFALQSLASLYHAMLAGLAIGLYGVWFIAAHRPRWSDLGRAVAWLGLSAGLAALVVVPLILPYFQVQRDLGFQRSIAESEPFSASLKLYTEVSPQNLVYGRWLAPRPPTLVGGYPLDNLFPGILAVALALIGLRSGRARDRIFYAFLFALAFLLSLGPRLFLTPSVGTGVTLPYRWLYDLVPLMRALRAPVRFDALVMFALAALAGLGTVYCTRRLSGGWGRWLPAVLGVLVSLEYLAIPAANIQTLPVGTEIPDYVRWLATQPSTTILELPMLATIPNRPLDLTPQYLSTYHWQRTPDGYSGFNPRLRGSITYEIESFPSERSLSLLQALDVKYVVVHSQDIAGWQSREVRLAQFAELTPVRQFGADLVYQVTARPQDTQALNASVYVSQPAAPGQTCAAYLIVQNHAARSVAIKPTDTLQIAARWSDGTTAQAIAALPLVTSRASVVPFSLTAPKAAGDYALTLTVSGAGIAGWNLTSDVVVRAQEPAHQIVLPAAVRLVTPFKATYKPGDSVEIDLSWMPYGKIDAYYSVSVRLIDARGNKLDAVDREPAGQTMLWTPNTTVADHFELTLPQDTAPGPVTAQVLVYQPNLGVDALLLDDEMTPQESLGLGSLTVQ